MSHTRREFLATTAVGAAAAALSPYGAYASIGRAIKPLRILILGGTGFLGPHCVEAALARGHTLTLFNRGRTEKVTGHDFAGEDGIERRYGNRDPEKLAVEAEPEGPENPKGLASLETGEWDAGIETPAYWPRIVGAPASLLSLSLSQPGRTTMEIWSPGWRGLSGMGTATKPPNASTCSQPSAAACTVASTKLVRPIKLATKAVRGWR